MGQARETSSFLPKETEGDQLFLAVGKLEILNSDEESCAEASVSEKQENCLHVDVLHNSIPTHHAYGSDLKLVFVFSFSPVVLADTQNELVG